MKRAGERLEGSDRQGITLKHYQDFSLFDLWSVIEKIPSPLDGTEVNTASLQERTIRRPL